MLTGLLGLALHFLSLAAGLLSPSTYVFRAWLHIYAIPKTAYHENRLRTPLERPAYVWGTCRDDGAPSQKENNAGFTGSERGRPFCVVCL